VTYGVAIRENFGRPQQEDAFFFQHVSGITSTLDTFRHGSYWSGLYRPLSTNLYYRLGHLWFGDRLTVYHTLNLFFFVANAILAFLLCRTFAPYPFALAVSLLFSTRLASTEVVLYTSHMQSLLPVFFSLLALLAYVSALRRGYAPLYFCLSLVCVLLGLLSKEAVISLPLICLVFLVVRPDTTWWRADARPANLALAFLPFAAVAPWALLAWPHLRVDQNPWWVYELRPLEIAGNYAAYALSFSNQVVAPLVLVVPCVKLNSYTAIMQARSDPRVQTLALAVLVVLCGLVPALGVLRRWRPVPVDLRRAVVGLAIFALAMAPMVVFRNRLLMYYGYFGHFGLSIFFAAAASPLLRALAKLARRAKH
jgi:hypothetical protein